MSVPLPSAPPEPAASSQPIPRRAEAPPSGTSYKASGTPSSLSRGNADNWRTSGASPTRNGASKPERTVGGFSSKASGDAAVSKEGGIGAGRPKKEAPKNNAEDKAGEEKKSEKASLAHVPCRFFKAGACTAGASCQFSHAAAEPGKQKEVCQWFIKGNCKFGHKCALAHILPGQPLSFDRKNKKAAQQSNASGGVPITGAGSGQSRRSGAVGSYEAGSNFPSSLTGNSLLGQQSSYGKSVAAASPSAIPMPTARREPYGPPSEDAAGSPSAGFGRSIDRSLVNAGSFAGYSASPSRPSPLTGLRSSVTNDSDIYRARPLSVPGPLAARSLRSGSFTAEQLASSPSRSLHPPTSAGPQANAFSSSPFTAPGKTGVFFSQSYGQDGAGALGDRYGASQSGAKPISASFANETSFSKSIWARKPVSLVEAGEDLSPGRPGMAFRRPDSSTRRTSDVFAVDEEDSEDEFGAGRYNDGGDVHEEELLPSSLSELLTPRENARRLNRRDSQTGQSPHTGAIGISPGFAAAARGQAYGRSLDAESVFARQAQSASAAVGVGGGGFLKNLWNDDGVDQRKKRADGDSPAEAQTGFQLGPSHASVAFLPNFGNRSNAASLLTQQQPSPPTVHTSHFSPSASPLSPSGAEGLSANQAILPSASPGTRALQSHAPGQSLPQGLAAGLSRLHLQPASRPSLRDDVSVGSSATPPLTSNVPLPSGHRQKDDAEDEELFAMDG